MLAMKMCMLAMRRYIGNVSYRDCEKDSRCCSQDTNVAWSCGASERVAATVFPPGFTNFARLKIHIYIYGELVEVKGRSNGVPNRVHQFCLAEDCVQESQQRCSQRGSSILLGTRSKWTEQVMMRRGRRLQSWQGGMSGLA